MTSTNDYPGEMAALPRIDDTVADDLLVGRPVAAELEPVATVVRALRQVAWEPVTPTAELAARMATGDFCNGVTRHRRPVAGQFDRGAIAADLRRTLAGRSGPWRWGSRVVAAGLAASLAGVSTAGFAGSLPDPVQDRFETVVETVTPFRFSDPGFDLPQEPRPHPAEPRHGDPAEPQRGSGDGEQPVVPGEEATEEEPAGRRDNGRAPDGPPGTAVTPPGQPGPPAGVPGPPAGPFDPGPPEPGPPELGPPELGPPEPGPPEPESSELGPPEPESSDPGPPGRSGGPGGAGGRGGR